jgi:hypothetical protein
MNYHGLTISSTSFKYGENYFYHLIFNESNQVILFQTSYLKLTKEPSYIQRFKLKTYFFNLSFYNLQQDVSLQTLQTELVSFESKMNKWINKKYKKKFVWHYSYKNQLEEMIWTLTSKEMDQLVLFDMQQKRLGIQQLQENVYVRLRIHINYIWFRKDTNIAGINYRIIQIQMNQLQLPLQCQFPCESITPSLSQPTVSLSITKTALHPVSEHPLYAKYFKMLAMKIPKEAVKQKMEMNKLPSDILDLSPNDELPLKYRQLEHEDTGDVLNQCLTDGVELSKCEPNEKRAITTTENKLTITIHDITERLRSLRPIKKESHLHTTNGLLNKKNQLFSILSQKLSLK